MAYVHQPEIHLCIFVKFCRLNTCASNGIRELHTDSIPGIIRSAVERTGHSSNLVRSLLDGSLLGWCVLRDNLVLVLAGQRTPAFSPALLGLVGHHVLVPLEALVGL